MIMIDLDNKYTIISNGEELHLVQRNGELRKDGTPAGKKWWFQTYGQAVKFYVKKANAEADIRSLAMLAMSVDECYQNVVKRIDQKMKELGLE